MADGLGQNGRCADMIKSPEQSVGGISAARLGAGRFSQNGRLVRLVSVGGLSEGRGYADGLLHSVVVHYEPGSDILNGRADVLESHSDIPRDREDIVFVDC